MNTIEKLMIKITVRLTIFIIIFLGYLLIDSLISIESTGLRWVVTCFLVLILPTFFQFLLLGEKKLEESRSLYASMQWSLISLGLVFIGNLIDFWRIKVDYHGNIDVFNTQTLPATATTLGIALIGCVIFTKSAVDDQRSIN